MKAPDRGAAAVPAIARASDAETLPMGSGAIQLLLDASDTASALSAHRVRLAGGQLGASPHRHTRLSEVLFVLEGGIDVLAGEQLLTATAGDLVLVPPENAHAFAAPAGGSADLLVMITPGIDRFEFFRSLAASIESGTGRPSGPGSESGSEDFDTYPTESKEWSAR